MTRLGKSWETESKKILKGEFPIVFKLINPEHIDFLCMKDNKKIYLVESKSTKKDRYYPLGDERKREQWKGYFETKRILEELGYEVEVWLLLKIKKKKKKFVFSSYSDIPKVITFS